MRPSRRLLILLALGLGLGIAAANWQPAAMAWLIAGGVLLGMALLDGIVLWTTSAPVGRRGVPHTLPVGVRSEVAVRISNPARRRVLVEVFDHLPPAAQLEGLPQSARVPAGSWVELRYAMTPLERGNHGFGRVQALLASPLGLWRRNCWLGEPQSVRIYPNFAEVAKYALFATDNRLSQLGIRKRRRRGEGLEFHQLREYRDGDPLRQIDWKASARLKRLISRDYQDERDQQIVFLIDCGRRMWVKDDRLSHFDHALNAMLLLSYVALRQGDAVGFMSFAGVDRFLPPQKGAPCVNAVLNSVYDLQPTLATPDYPRAATDLLRRLRKRSLVILLTNLRDEDNAELAPAIALLRRQHLVLVASLREAVLRTVGEQTVRSFQDALRLAATDLYAEERDRAHREAQGFGALLMDTEPQHLPVALVNRYLDIKAGGRL